MMATSTPTDGELIARFLDGQATAFDALVRRYEREVFGFLFHMVRDEALANDLFQETFLRIMEALPRYREKGRFQSWVFRVARNLALDALRRRTFERGLFAQPAHEDGDPSRDEGITSPEVSPDAVAERAEWAAHLEAAIASLPEEQREVVILRYEAGLTFREIAEITGVSINTALGRMRYATQALRKKLAAFAAEDER